MFDANGIIFWVARLNLMRAPLCFGESVWGQSVHP